MQSCLGIYIEQNLIKYAKVSKNNDALKVESFGIKFFDNINIALKQIVDETYSFKTPISINTSDEIYNEIEVFSMLSKKDMEDVIKTEFESICAEKDISKNIFEARYLLTNSNIGEQKLKAIHVSLPKTMIEQRKNQFFEYKVNNMIPTSISISNLLKKERSETSLIINIEKDTIITKIKNAAINKVSVLNIGAETILSNINKKENTYSKSYEICKNTTIYTETDRDLQYEENEYLEDVMPTLYQIASQVRNFIRESMDTIDKVYITGTGAMVNNIDIYFQEYLNNISCEILKPYFINNNSKINIKDYIEVNSAISLALSGLDKQNNGMNFLRSSSGNKFTEILKTDISIGGPVEVFKSANEFLIKYNKQYTIIASNFVLLTVIYALISGFLSNRIDYKMALAEDSISNTKQKIQTIQDYNKKFNSFKSKYQILINNIEDLNNTNSEDRRFKNAIPNLLNNIMTIIPTNVQLMSIENTTDTHIVIKAKSNNYDEIAFFKTKLKTEEILKNVVSDVGTTQGGYLSVTIEGELP